MVLLAIATVVLAMPERALAQALHVYGPEGNGRERRCLAVVEAADGSCASWDEVSLSAEGGSVALGETVGACARWITLARDDESGSVLLSAEIDGASADALVSLGTPTTLRVRPRREGTQLVVEVEGVSSDVPMRAWAVWSEGRVDLAPRRRPGALEGEVPAGAMLGIVVRVGERTGAAALPAERPTDRPELLVIPSDLAVSAGSTPRPVAFLVVADEHGRLSRSVPLNVQSERASLTRLEWIEPGLAEVWLSTEVGEGMVDLAVHAGVTAVSTELWARSSWPVALTIAAPESVAEGDPVEVVVTATALDGSPLGSDGIEVRWGGVELTRSATPGRFVGAATAVPGPLVAYVRIDGPRVPLAVAAIEVHPRATHDVETAPVPAATVRVRLAVGASAAVDLWARAGLGALASGRIQLAEPIWLELWARYSATWTLASPRGVVRDPLMAVTHSAELDLLGRLEPFGASSPLSFFLGLGASGDFLTGTVGTVPVSSETLTGVLIGGVGATFRVDGFSLGVDGHVRLSNPLSAPVQWDAPALRFGIDVTGGFDGAL